MSVEGPFMVGLRDGAFKVGVALLQGVMQSIAHILEASVDTDGMQEWFKPLKQRPLYMPRPAPLDGRAVLSALVFSSA